LVVDMAAQITLEPLMVLEEQEALVVDQAVTSHLTLVALALRVRETLVALVKLLLPLMVVVVVVVAKAL
jgi:hypothetical protein